MDTSVWVAALRSNPPGIGQCLAKLTDQDGVVLPVVARLELLAGSKREGRPRLQRNLAELKELLPTPDTWSRMEGWCAEASEAGQRFGFADLLIAALAAEVGAEVWSLDRAFERMEKLGFIQCFRLPA